ncbi:hypothetical protein KXS11_00635 [Plantibacter flavus]|uniref:hypothetical protein n=1 Tax=Plantibacter flavus TaxID=150123 RepID=UPI003F149015
MTDDRTWNDAAGTNPLDPAPEVLAEIDRRDAACKASPGEVDPQIRLWQAVVALEQWVFINRGTAEAPRPYALAAQAGQMLCVFSSGSRAEAAARANGLVAADARVELFSIPVPAAIDWAMAFGERGVTGVTIDYPQLGAWCPLPNLAGLRASRSD